MLKKIKRKFVKLLHPVQGDIWCLHRVTAKRSLFAANSELELTPEFLESKITDLQRNGYKFVTLDEICNKKVCRVGKKRIHITFDDGFRDVYTSAFPILQKHKVPFTLYLTTDFPQKNIVLWWLILEDILMKNNEILLVSGEKFSCANFDEKQILFSSLSEKIYSSDQNPVQSFVELFGYEAVDKYADFCKSLVLSWQQIREMAESGLCEIGSHSVSHPILTKISEKEVLAEVTQSKQIIENQINRQVRHFSYPHSFINEKIEKTVAEAGYKTAALGYGGFTRLGNNKYRLPRNYIVQK